MSIFTMDSQVQNNFPEIHVAYCLIDNVSVSAANPELEELKTNTVAQLMELLKDAKITEIPRIAGFRRIYKTFGIDPGSKRPSAEALVRRIASGKGLYTVNTAVDAYNLCSAKHQLPMAAYNLDAITFPIELRYGKSGDEHFPIGATSPDMVSENELVYSDQSTVICRDFNYRDSDITKVTTDTKNLILFVDGCSAVSQSEIQEILIETAKLIQRFNGGEIRNAF